MKKQASLYLFVICVPLLMSESNAQQPVDVLVAAAPSGGALSATAWADIMQSALNVTMNQSDMSSRQFQFRPFLLTVADAPQGVVNTGAALNFIIDNENQLLTAARNNASNTLPLGVTSFDLVVLIVDALVSNRGAPACGAARPIYDIATGFSPVSLNASETKFAIVVSRACAGGMPETIAHEIGHIFGGEHQTAVNGTPIDPANDDSDPNWPTDKNHPVVYFKADGTLDATSVLVGKSGGAPRELQYSSNAPGHTLHGTAHPSGNSKADMKEIIYAQWDRVSTYRPLPDPPSCQIWVEFNNCDGSYSSNALSASLPGYSILNIDYDVSYNNSTWIDLYEGFSSCPSFSSNVGMWGRAIFTLATGQISQCTIFVTPTDCSGGGRHAF